MTHELDELGVLNVKDVLEVCANLHEDLLRLLRGASRLALLVGVGLGAGAAGPEADTVESLTDVDDDTHDLVVVVVLQLLADGGEKDVKPDVVVGLALLEGVGPTAAVLVLGVFPFGADTLLEQVVIGLGGELGRGSDVVLLWRQTRRVFVKSLDQTHVDAPELLNAVEADDLLQQFIPILL